MEEKPVRAIDALPYSIRSRHRGGKVIFRGELQVECRSGRVVLLPTKYSLASGRARLAEACGRRLAICKVGKPDEWETFPRHSDIAFCRELLPPLPVIVAAFAFVASEQAQPAGRKR